MNFTLGRQLYSRLARARKFDYSSRPSRFLVVRDQYFEAVGLFVSA